MAEESLREFAALHARSQASLREFFSVDLQIAFTLLDTARIEAYLDPEHRPAIIAQVESALSGVRHLLGRIEDPQVWNELHSRANDLERQLRAEA